MREKFILLILFCLIITKYNSQILKKDDFSMKTSFNIIQNNNLSTLFTSNEINYSFIIMKKVQCINNTTYNYSGWFTKKPTQNEFYYRLGFNYNDSAKKVKPTYYLDFESSLNRMINNRYTQFFGLKYSFTQKSSFSFGFMWENVDYYKSGDYYFERMSSRIKINEKFGKHKILLENFIQPVVSDFKNIRIKNNMTYGYKLNSYTDFTINFNWSYESFNPTSLSKKNIINSSIGFEINL